MNSLKALGARLYSAATHAITTHTLAVILSVAATSYATTGRVDLLAVVRALVADQAPAPAAPAPAPALSAPDAGP